MMDVMTELKPIGELFKAGCCSDALTELERLWEKVPNPKEATLNSYLIVSSGVAIALKANRLDEAWTWARRGLPYSGNFNLAGESEFLLGEVAFARSDYETAIKQFKTVKRMSGWRLFKSKDPKYRQLIEGS
jgi:hypothetical protein